MLTQVRTDSDKQGAHTPTTGESIKYRQAALRVWIRWGELYHLKRLKLYALQEALLLLRLPCEQKKKSFAKPM